MIRDAYLEYLAALREGRRQQAFQVVRRARAAGIDLPTLYLEVFQPALREIGRLWQENEISVAEEHLATAITQSAMLRVYGEFDIPEAGGPVLIAACTDSERHEIGLRMLCDLLDLAGWDTVFLGSAVPAADLVAMVRARRPHAVALSASIEPHLRQLRTTIDAIREGAGDARPLIVVGGRALLDSPELVAELGADLTAADAVEAAAMLQDLVQ